ncbi:MAG TPA: hypothetical protein VGI82_10855 [Chitinophagaceae bacterium]
MKKLLTFIPAVIFFTSLLSQTWIKSGDATRHDGDTVSLIGLVTNITYPANQMDLPISFNLKMNNPQRSLILIIPGSDRFKFASFTADTYKDQYVRVTGRIEINKGQPQIILRAQSQIAIAREAWPEEE